MGELEVHPYVPLGHNPHWDTLQLVLLACISSILMILVMVSTIRLKVGVISVSQNRDERSRCNYDMA